MFKVWKRAGEKGVQKGSRCNRNKSDQIYLLIKAFQDHHDIDAHRKLIIQFENLVDAIARKYSRGKVLQEDLFQVGMLGLLAAIRRYDASYGTTFESFATLTINGEIKRYLRDKTWGVHVPRRIKELGPKIRRTIDELTTKLQRTPTITDIAEALKMSEQEIIEALEMGKGYNTLSIHQPLRTDSDEENITLLDIIGTIDEGYEKVNQSLEIEQALHYLNEREKYIIQSTFLKEMSQKETSEQLGISQMHVSRLQRSAIKRLQQAVQLEEKKRDKK